MINFKDKKILITGATGGIGKALVKKFGKENKYQAREMGDKDSKFTTYGLIIPISELMDFDNINDYKEY